MREKSQKKDADLSESLRRLLPASPQASVGLAERVSIFPALLFSEAVELNRRLAPSEVIQGQILRAQNAEYTKCLKRIKAHFEREEAKP